MIEIMMELEEHFHISLSDEAIVGAYPGSSKRENVLPGLTVEKLAFVVGARHVARRVCRIEPRPAAWLGGVESQGPLRARAAADRRYRQGI